VERSASKCQMKQIRNRAKMWKSVFKGSKSSSLASWFSAHPNAIRFDHYAYLHDFLEFSAAYWVSHFETANTTDETQVLISALQVCDPRSWKFMTWFFAYEHKHVVGYLLRDGITFTQLMIVSYLGLENLAQLLLRGNIDVNEKWRAAARWPTRTALSTADSLSKNPDKKKLASGVFPLSKILLNHFKKNQSRCIL